MKVLHVISSIDRRKGGPSAAVIGLANAQVQAGYQASIITTFTREEDSSDDSRSPAEAKNAPITRVGPCRTPAVWHPQLSSALKFAIGGANIVHIHGVWESIHRLAAAIARNQAKPYIFQACGMLDPWSLRQKRLKKALYLHWVLRCHLESASALHYDTAMEAGLAGELGLTPPTLIRPNGVDVAEFKELPAAGTFRRSLPQHMAERPLVVFLGRVHPIKGIDTLIRALPKLADSTVGLVIVGPDAEGTKATLAALADALGVSNRIHFSGMLHGKDRVAALRDAKVFALASQHENFGIAVIEALAAGIPVVLSDQVGIHAEVVANGVGSAVPVDADAFAAAINHWLKVDGENDGLSNRCRNFVFENFDWANIATLWAKDYARLLAGRS